MTRQHRQHSYTATVIGPDGRDTTRFNKEPEFVLRRSGILITSTAVSSLPGQETDGGRGTTDWGVMEAGEWR